MTTRFGHLSTDEYTVASWIWGHRLRQGQHWMEYLLEFLNVLAGFDFELGQGLENSPKPRYKRLKRLGLRRFVFYDDHEKTRHPLDDRARQLLETALQAKTSAAAIGTNNEPLLLARSLLRSYSAIEDERSWYAKTLFPVHEKLLFWEGLRKRATIDKTADAVNEKSPRDLDVGMSFGARDFFARGGEIYYLILSAGTQHNQLGAMRIASQLKTLLQARNQEVGELAQIIDQTWYELRQNEASADESEYDEAELGWIPSPQCALYRVIAEDVDGILSYTLDPLESLQLLAHLICFHIIQYIYHRAKGEVENGDCERGDCLQARKPLLLVDCLEGKDGGIVRQISSTLYREHELQQANMARRYIKETISSLGTEFANDPNFAALIEDRASQHFNLHHLKSKKKTRYERAFAYIQDQFHINHTQGEFTEGYIKLLDEILFDDFREHFLNIHRKLGRRISFIAPRTGRNARYVLGDTLLKALVLANVAPNSEMQFDDLLIRLYERYGLIVGAQEADRARLNERRAVNTAYYDDNRFALLETMKRAGLVREYSDATAMVSTRYD